VAKAAVEAEFPDFLVLNSFAVCALSDQERVVAATSADQTHCQRLAKLFSVSPQELARQLARLRPAAQAVKNTGKCSNYEAWRKAVQSSSHCGGRRLGSVVMRYLVWSSSTTGVEQRFSVGDRLAVEKTPASQVYGSSGSIRQGRPPGKIFVKCHAAIHKARMKFNAHSGFGF
jgi:hypothetical protein